MEEIESQALSLPPERRASLARRLLESLDEPAELERAWSAEAARRAEDLSSGEVDSVPAEGVFVEARGVLG